jgi:hypothetical protein
MKQNFIFAIILLATFSMVNAIPYQLHKRATTFVPCPSGSQNSITVTIQPDPPISNGELLITVSGTLTSGTIDTGSQFVFQAFNKAGEGGTPTTVDICSKSENICPIVTGNSFSIVNKVTTGTLTGTYTIAVSILNATGAVLACSIGTVTGA